MPVAGLFRLISLSKCCVQARVQKRLDFIASQTDLLMHFEPKGAGYQNAKEGPKSKRGRMSEKAEDELMMKRAETEAAGNNVFADDQRLTKQPSILKVSLAPALHPSPAQAARSYQERGHLEEIPARLAGCVARTDCLRWPHKTTGSAHLSTSTDTLPCRATVAGRLTDAGSDAQNGTLREYQLEGLNWLARLYNNGISGILADEMGLGKTVQTVAMIGYLTEFKDAPGPHMVLAPKSTMSNWIKEFRKWLPDHRIVYVGGSKEEREQQLKTEVQPDKFDVVITSFEIVCREKNHFKKFHWRYFVIDEAHRIKNEKSQLSMVVRELKTHSRLLLTGTPLQNNLHELWALLNFLLPEEFADADDFDAFFDSSEKAEEVTGKLHRILRPFLLRRLKADVEKGLPCKTEINMYVPMSAMQKKLYANLLKKDVDAINGKGGERSRLLNIVMQLRKCCNHPYLFEGQEPGPPFVEGEHLVENSYKLRVLDKLLDKAKAEGNRVLIFSQMTRVLDILEDYCWFRSHKYCRIDGGIAGEVRENMIEDFMRDDSDKFIFLLSTRAGGLGLNLQKANWVVLFDSDWNPQVDIQAMDRAHRIGQTKEVMIYRFITESSVEEKVLERAFKKLFLDAMVVQQGRLSEKHKAASKDELLDMIRFGADTVIRMTDAENEDFDIDEVLAKGKAKTEEMNAKVKEMAGSSMAANFSMDGTAPERFVDIQEDDGAASNFFLDIGQRDRKSRGYNIDQLYREQMSGKKEQKQPTGPKMPKHLITPQFAEFHFFNTQRLDELYAKKRDWWNRQQVALKEKESGDKKDDDGDVVVDGPEIDANEGWTAEEKAESEALLEEGFRDWSKKDFSVFKSACERHGRSAYDSIAQELESKDAEEVQRYAEAFWRLGPTRLSNWDSVEKQIEKGESKIQKRQECMHAVKRKVERYASPWQHLKFQYGNAKGKAFTEEEDRFIVCMCHQLGYGRWEELKYEVRRSWNFRFDWFIKSRTPKELEARFKQLVRLIEKELEAEDAGGAKRKAVGDAAPAATAAAAAAAAKKPKVAAK
jgi:SWI/SNF-related matrix-associated actin-dependent regulator of chromatin subfamily A member 5